MLSNKIIAPFLFIALIFLYLTWEYGSKWAIYIVPCIVVIAVIYVMSPQIDWWYAKRNPPNLPLKMLQLFDQFSPFFQGLSADEKKRFNHRVAMFEMGTDWTPQGWDDVPKDVSTVLAGYGAMLNFHSDNLVLEKFEKVIVYPHPFPTPAYPNWHHSETYEPDGCLLFSAEQVMQGFAQPGQFYQIGLHEYANAYVLSHPTKPWPIVNESYWSVFEQMNGMGKTHTESMVGMPVPNLLPVAIHHYYAFPEQFRMAAPELAEALDRVFS